MQAIKHKQGEVNKQQNMQKQKREENTTKYSTDIQCESKKSSPAKTFCGIFSPGEPV